MTLSTSLELTHASSAFYRRTVIDPDCYMRQTRRGSSDHECPEQIRFGCSSGRVIHLSQPEDRSTFQKNFFAALFQPESEERGRQMGRGVRDMQIARSPNPRRSIVNRSVYFQNQEPLVVTPERGEGEQGNRRTWPRAKILGEREKCKSAPLRASTGVSSDTEGEISGQTHLIARGCVPRANLIAVKHAFKAL